MVRLVFVSLILLTGCHVVFGLENAPIDAAVEDGSIDVVFDARADSTVIGDGRVCWDLTLLDNEDGDIAKDGCDNCPAVDNDDQVNSDNDDLGDVCDPHPTQEDRIVLWHNFKTAVDPGWVPLGGAGVWSHDVGAGAYAQTLNSNGSTISVYGARKFTNATVEVVMAGVRSPITFNTATAGVYLWTDKSPPVTQVPAGELCIERRPNDGPINDVVQIVERGGDNSTTVSGPIIGSRTDPSYLRFSSRHDGQSDKVACALGRGTNAPAVTPAQDLSGQGYIALITGNTATSFRSVLVSETP